MTVQDIVLALPKPLRRLRVAGFMAALSGTPYHPVRFQSGMLIGNVRDGAVCDALVKRHCEVFGYYDIARALIRDHGVHVDAGANYGFYTFGLFDQPYAKSSRFLLIDANPDCIRCHEMTRKLFPEYDMTSVHYALSDRPGEVWFSYEGARLVPESTGQNASIKVPANTLDRILRQNNIETVDLLKMDIEGSEVAALHGCSEYLASKRIKGIYFEVNPSCLSAQNTSREQLVDLLTEYGYRLFWPHAAMDWILRQYNNPSISARDVKIYECGADWSLLIAQFDPAFCRPLEGGQYDLLAFPENVAAGFRQVGTLGQS